MYKVNILQYRNLESCYHPYYLPILGSGRSKGSFIVPSNLSSSWSSNFKYLNIMHCIVILIQFIIYTIIFKRLDSKKKYKYLHSYLFLTIENIVDVVFKVGQNLFLRFFECEIRRAVCTTIRSRGRGFIGELKWLSFVRMKTTAT